MIDQIKGFLSLSQVGNLFNIDGVSKDRMTCPKCGSTTACTNVGDSHYHCYKCGCHGDVINLLIDSGKAKSVKESIYMLKSHCPVGDRAWQRRMIALKQAFSIYEKEASENRGTVLKFTESRGWIDVPILGLSTSSTLLRESGMSTLALQEAELLVDDKEYYSNHVIFPVHNEAGEIVHLNGRNLDPNAKLRWKSTKGKPSIDRFLYNQCNVGKGNNEVLVICEGVPDCISLMQLQIQAVGQFGVNVKLEKLAGFFKQFDNLVFAYDVDEFALEPGSKENKRYKSWGCMLQHVTDLLRVIKKPAYVMSFPAGCGKDINEWLLDCNYEPEKDMSEYCIPIADFAAEVYTDIHEHHLLWALVAATDNTELSEKLVEEGIQKYGSAAAYFQEVNKYV